MAKAPMIRAGTSKAHRIPRRIRTAVQLMVRDGLNTQQAADQIKGLSQQSLARALASPDVRRLLDSELDVLRASERPGAFQRIVGLSKMADSDRVKLDANKYVIDPRNSGGGVTVNVGVSVQNGQQPGYVIAVPEHLARQMGGEQVEDGRTIEHDSSEHGGNGGHGA